jgi:hypothetical protein
MAQDKPLDKYIRIVQRLRAGKKVSPEEIKHFLTFTTQVDDVKLAKIREKLSTAEGIKNITDDDVSTIIEEGRKELASDKYKEDVLDIAKEAESGRTSEAIRTGLNTLLAAGDIVASVQQIAESNKLLNQSKKPGRPSVPGRDPYLQQALSQAQQGSFDQSRALAPAQQGIQNQYLSDLNNAQIASTGQAGTYGALAQVAANRRNEANVGLIPIADQLRQQEKQRLDSLVGMRMNETQNQFQNQAQFYPQDLAQYNLDQQAAGALGATGRSNLRTSMANFGQQIPEASNYLTNRKYAKLYNQFSPYGKENAQIAVDTKKFYDDRFGMTPEEEQMYMD